MKRRRLLLGSAWLGVLAAVAFVGSVITPGAEAQPSSCPKPLVIPDVSGKQREAPILETAEGAAIIMHFDESRAQDTYFVPLKAYKRKLSRRDFVAVGGLDVVLTGGYLRRDLSHRIALHDDGIRVTLVPVSTRELDLCLVVHPKDIGRLAPGTYRGAIAVVYGIEKTPLASVQVELTFRASRWTAISIAFLAVLLGLAVKILSEAAAEQRATGVGAIRALKTYASRLSFPVMLILAAVAGSLAFLQMYAGSPDWGGSTEDIGKLFAVCFIAQMGSNEGIDIIRRFAGGGPGMQPAIPAGP